MTTALCDPQVATAALRVAPDPVKAIVVDIETIPTQDPDMQAAIRTEAYEKQPNTNTLKALKEVWHTSEAKEARYWDALLKTALDPTRGQIVCICASTNSMGGGGVIRVDLMRQTQTEGAEEFARWYDRVATQDTVLCGHNSNGFDIPYLLFLFARYGVQPPQFFPYLYNGRLHGRTYDTMLSTPTSGAPFISLKEDLVRYGLGLRKGAPSGLDPDMDMDGSKVYGMWQQGNYDLILDYCANDVRVQLELTRRQTHNFSAGPFRRTENQQAMDQILVHPDLTREQKILALYNILEPNGNVPRIPY